MLGKFEDEYYDLVLNKVKTESVAKNIVFKIIEDLTDRRGLEQQFNNFDDDIQEEIVSKWIEIVEKSL